MKRGTFRIPIRAGKNLSRYLLKADASEPDPVSLRRGELTGSRIVAIIKGQSRCTFKSEYFETEERIIVFKRRVEDSGKCPVWRFAFRIFYAHIANVLIMLVAAMLVENLGLLNIHVSDGVTPVVVTIVCFLFYVIYVYVQSWRVGQRDQNLILYKHETKQPLKALYAALLSQLPGFVLAVALQFPSAGFAYVRYARYFSLHFNWFLLNYGESQTWLYFVPLVFAPIVASFAYWLGSKGTFLADKLVYRAPDEAKKDEKGE